MNIAISLVVFLACILSALCLENRLQKSHRGTSRDSSGLLLEINFILTAYLYWESQWMTSFVLRNDRKLAISECEIGLRLKSLFYIFTLYFPQRIARHKIELTQSLWETNKLYIQAIIADMSSDIEHHEKTLNGIAKSLNTAFPSHHQSLTDVVFYKYIKRQKSRIDNIRRLAMDREACIRQEILTDFFYFTEYFSINIQQRFCKRVIV